MAAKGVLQFASKASLRDANALLASYKVSRDCRWGFFTGVDATFRGFLSRDGGSAPAHALYSRCVSVCCLAYVRTSKPNIWCAISSALAACLCFCDGLRSTYASSPLFFKPLCDRTPNRVRCSKGHCRAVRPLPYFVVYLVSYYVVIIRLRVSEVFLKPICLTAGSLSLSLPLSFSPRSRHPVRV